LAGKEFGLRGKSVLVELAILLLMASASVDSTGHLLWMLRLDIPRRR
jgi:hypothetical protein